MSLFNSNDTVEEIQAKLNQYNPDVVDDPTQKENNYVFIAAMVVLCDRIRDLEAQLDERIEKHQKEWSHSSSCTHGRKYGESRTRLIRKT